MYRNGLHVHVHGIWVRAWRFLVLVLSGRALLLSLATLTRPGILGGFGYNALQEYVA